MFPLHLPHPPQRRPSSGSDVRKPPRGAVSSLSLGGRGPLPSSERTGPWRQRSGRSSLAAVLTVTGLLAGMRWWAGEVKTRAAHGLIINTS